MKPHVHVKLRSNGPAPSLPAWPEVEGRRALLRESCLPDVDRLVRERDLSLIATRSARPRPCQSVLPQMERFIAGRLTPEGCIS